MNPFDQPPIASEKNPGTGNPVQLIVEAIEHAQIGLMLTDCDQKILSVNSRFTEMTEYSPDEIIGKTPKILQSGYHSGEFYQDLLETILKGQIWEGDIYNRKKNGACFWEATQIIPVRDSNQNISQFLALKRISNNPKKSPVSLQYPELDKNILDCILDGLCMVDAEENIVYANQAFTQIFNIPLAEKKGRSILDVYARNTGGNFLQQTAQHKKKYESSSYDLPVKSHPSIDCIRVLISPKMDEQNHYIGAIHIVQDITAQKKAENEHKKYAEELKRSNEQLEQFAYIASHDLQEPLRMITSYLQLLKKRYHGNLSEEANDFLGFAVDSATRMSHMIHALLIYSRVGTRGKNPSPVNTNDVLKNVLVNLNLLIQESQAEITNDPLPVVTADKNQLHQLFQNLIINAIKFHGVTTPRIHIGVQKKPGFWEFGIHDHGIGIAEEDTERIFNIFQRVEQNRSTPGAGIGLAICKRITERHGGSIRVQSQPGAGSVFYFTFPDSMIPD